MGWISENGTPAYSEYLRYLPPANEVWGKVIFSQVCVKNSVHRGSAWSWGGGAWSWEGSGLGGVWSGGVWSGGVPGGDPPGMATAAGGTHPTGMHSCLVI